jgi:hypothetical protein
MKHFIEKYNGVFRLVFIVCLFLLGFAGYNLYKTIWPSPYVSTSDNFSAVFPGSPSVNNLASQKQDNGTVVSGHIYDNRNDSASTDYAVYVTKYSNINFDKYDYNYRISTLQNQLETLAKNDSANISNGNTITFNDGDAVEATFTPSSKSEVKSYVLATTKHNKLYILIGAGITKDQYKTFISKFKFLHP